MIFFHIQAPPTPKLSFLQRAKYCIFLWPTYNVIIHGFFKRPGVLWIWRTPIPLAFNSRYFEQKCNGLYSDRKTKQYDVSYPLKSIGMSHQMLYGASTNYLDHTDACFNLPGIRFYRVLIGLTENQYVETLFPKLNASKFISKYDYVIFDFDKALHKVVNHDTMKHPRILLKLHFCACDTCHIGGLYFKSCVWMYELYEVITRYIMKTGTNPTSYWDFYCGLLCHIWVRYNHLLTLFVLILCSTLVIMIFSIKVAYPLCIAIRDVFIIYCCIVALFWLRYQLFRVR